MRMSNSPCGVSAFDSGLCRCCALEMKNCLRLDVEYDSSGRKEVYANMIMDCYGFLLLHLDSEPTDCLICSACVERLREALAFRQQVLRSEETFLLMKNGAKNKDFEGTAPALIVKVEMKSEPEECDKDLDYETLSKDAGNFVDDAPESLGDDSANAANDAAHTSADDASEGVPFPKKPRLASHSESQNEKRNEITAKRKTRTRNKTKVSTYHCEICDTKFSCKNNLLQHLICAHTQQSGILSLYPCTECDYKSNQQIDLTIHMRTHTGERSPLQFHCKTCDEKFSDMQKWKMHLKTHRVESYRCGQCDYSTKQKQHMENHIRKHTGERPYHCKICNKKFKQIQNLRNHLMMHSEDRPFSCDQCQYKCKAKYNLKGHMKLHSGERPYRCEICEKRFSHKPNLTRHLTMHSDEKPFSCQQCEFRCKLKRNLNHHMKRHTYEQVIPLSLPRVEME